MTRPRSPYDPPLEGEESKRVRGLLGQAGFWTGSTSQYRRSGQVVGLPDLVIMHQGLGQGGWWETKRYKKEGFLLHDRSTWVPLALTPPQWEFRQRALKCGHLHGYGGIKEVEAFLAELGLGKMRDGVFWLGSIGLRRIG